MHKFFKTLLFLFIIINQEAIAQLKVTALGTVGIGTNNPLQNYKLDIFGNVILTNSGRILIGSDQRYLGVGYNSDLTIGNATSNLLRIGSQSGIGLWGTSGFDDPNANNINSPDIYIYPTGYTKIGSDFSPIKTKLEINGDGLLSRNGRLFFTSYIGYLGISDQSNDISLFNNNNQWLRIGSAGGVAFWGMDGFDNRNAWNYAIPDMFIDKKGNVGIGGLPSQSYRFHVIRGNSNFDGDIFVNGVWKLSDIRLKRKIIPIINPIEVISRLNGKTYEYVGDIKEYNFEEGRKAGLIAQEVQEILPFAVKTREDGYLAVDYSTIIPYLIEAIKEQNRKVELLETQLRYCCLSEAFKSNFITKDDNSLNSSMKDIFLFQNSPNPFTTNTIIKFQVPERIRTASIGIYNLNGEFIKSYDINSRGIGEIIILSKELFAGIFLYTLIADGKLIDTKKMLLTE